RVHAAECALRPESREQPLAGRVVRHQPHGQERDRLYQHRQLRPAPDDQRAARVRPAAQLPLRQGSQLRVAALESAFYLRTFQLATAAILGYLLLKILDPLSGMLGWAAVLAFILHPLQERLAQRLRGRRALSAGIITALTPFLVLAPLSVLTGAFVGQVTRLIE